MQALLLVVKPVFMNITPKPSFCKTKSSILSYRKNFCSLQLGMLTKNNKCAVVFSPGIAITIFNIFTFKKLDYNF